MFFSQKNNFYNKNFVYSDKLHSGKTANPLSKFLRITSLELLSKVLQLILNFSKGI